MEVLPDDVELPEARRTVPEERTPARLAAVPEALVPTTLRLPVTLLLLTEVPREEELLRLTVSLLLPSDERREEESPLLL